MSRCNHISFPDAEFYLMNLFLNANNEIAKALKKNEGIY